MSLSKGRRQADSTGKRLAELALPYSLIVRSTMSRAQETSKIIEKSLPNVTTVDDSLITEGAPIPPEPPIGNWKSDSHVSVIFIHGFLLTSQITNINNFVICISISRMDQE